MTIEEKIREIIKLMKEYTPLRDYFKVVVSLYHDEEVVVNLKPYDWEFYGETLDIALDEAIKALKEDIQEKEEEEREYYEQRERDYWEVQGAKTGFVKCF